jgi:hypothetical protein
MAAALTSEQVNQVVNNTTLVLLVRPDLMAEWRANLMDLLEQTRQAALDEESIFVSAVLTLLYSPGDTLPTGTTYDHAWQLILIGLQQGEIQPAGARRGDDFMTIERLLRSVAEALVAVLTEIPDQKDAVAAELAQMHSAALEADVPELCTWIDDAMALLRGTPAADLGAQHEGIYGVFWQAVVQNLHKQRGNEAL